MGIQELSVLSLQLFFVNLTLFQNENFFKKALLKLATLKSSQE